MVAAVLVIASIYFTFRFANLQTGNVLVTLTDPPIVPTGTQALYMNYSSVSVSYLSHNSSGISMSNITGKIDLISLGNSSTVLANFNIPNGSSIQSVRFNVSSAYIVINNISYPVFLQ